jgi:hypothetical protein
MISLFLHCTSKPKPWNPTNKNGFKTAKIAPKLDEAWKQQLALLEDSPNKQELQENICKLTIEDRKALLDTLLAINNPAQRKHFLESLASFTPAKQAHLLNIILYLKENDEKLVVHILNCSKSLSLLEELHLLQITHKLPEQCQELLEQFGEKLQEEDQDSSL